MSLRLAITLLILGSVPASASITAFWRQNTITPQAITADPALANMQSWSLMATTTGNWASAGVEAILPAGNVFYNPPLGGNTFLNPLIVVTFPHVAFDTYVTGPGDIGVTGAPAILGFFPEAPGPGDFGGTTGRFSVSWGDLTNDPPGTYEIARLTWPIGVFPSINPLSHTSQVNLGSSSFIPYIPEPHSISLIVGAGMLVLARRRLTRRLALVAIALLPFLATPASASITAFWRANPITPQAIASDPALATMQSWSLMTTTTGNWNYAGMSVYLLPLGSGYVFYNPSNGLNTRPAAATIALHPNLEFDTYASSPGDQGGGVGAPAILGGHYGSPVADFGGMTGLFDVAWGDLILDPPGTYEIARLTFPAASGSIVSSGGATAQVNPDASVYIPQIPEPASGGFIAAIMLVLCRRRLLAANRAIVVVLPMLISSTASASITAFWRQNTITPAAIAADPALAGMQSWSVWGTMSGNWAEASIAAYLPLGQRFYHAPEGGDTRPSASTVAMFPHVEFDTYVTSPKDQGGGDGAPVLLGRADKAPGPPDFGGTTGGFTARWGNLVPDPPGTYEIARLTFPSTIPIPYDVSPLYSRMAQSDPSALVFIPDIGVPEPPIGILVPATVVALRLRRR